MENGDNVEQYLADARVLEEAEVEIVGVAYTEGEIMASRIDTFVTATRLLKGRAAIMAVRGNIDLKAEPNTTTTTRKRERKQKVQLS